MALFGSVAREEHNENSDVDLLIKFKQVILIVYSLLISLILDRTYSVRSSSVMDDSISFRMFILSISAENSVFKNNLTFSSSIDCIC